MRKARHKDAKIQRRKDTKIAIVLALLLLIVGVSCKKNSTDNSHNVPPGGYQITVDATTYTIPATAVTFAQQHYDLNAQQMREYQVATTLGSPNYGQGLGIWKSETWQVRQQYLVSPFDNDVRTSDSAQFYYQLGGIPAQFGFGWKDTFDPATFNPDSTYTTSIWPTDQPGSPGWDGQSPWMAQYRGMWTVE